MDRILLVRVLVPLRRVRLAELSLVQSVRWLVQSPAPLQVAWAGIFSAMYLATA